MNEEEKPQSIEEVEEIFVRKLLFFFPSSSIFAVKIFVTVHGHSGRLAK
jgi:hypothetical protein